MPDPQTGGWSALPAVTADQWGELRLEWSPFNEDLVIELVPQERETERDESARSAGAS